MMTRKTGPTLNPQPMNLHGMRGPKKRGNGEKVAADKIKKNRLVISNFLSIKILPLD